MLRSVSHAAITFPTIFPRCEGKHRQGPEWWGSLPGARRGSRIPNQSTTSLEMRALVIKFLAVVCVAHGNASVIKNIFNGFRKSSPDEHEVDCSEPDDYHPEYHSTRRQSFTSPSTLWRMPTSPSYDHFEDPFTLPSGHDHKNRDRKREDSVRPTTERWRPSYDSFGTRGSEDRDVIPRQTSTSFPQRAKTTSGESFGNEVERDSLEGLDGVKMRLAEKWCSRYEKKCVSSRTTRNGITTRITGGRRAQPKKHRHMVMIGYGFGDKKQWLCGGSLISSRFVLSAAHCSQTAKLGAARWVLLGELDISTTDDDARPQEKEIVERLNHPNYQEPATYHDIALFKMDSDVVFTAWVYPACLHFSRNIPAASATVTGWGRTGFVSEISNALLEVDVNIFNDSLCTSTINKLAGPKMPRGYDAATMICAGDIAGGKDACQGDSGGPLIITDDSCIKTQIGITSIGSDCGLPESPGVYTRVSDYVSWIEGIVWS